MRQYLLRSTCLGKDAKTHPVFGGKACFACEGNVKFIDDPAVQAIISYSARAEPGEPGGSDFTNPGGERLH